MINRASAIVLTGLGFLIATAVAIGISSISIPHVIGGHRSHAFVSTAASMGSTALSYDYTVDGHPFTGHRYSFNLESSSDRDARANFVQAHPPGTPIEIWYEPRDPAISVVIPGLREEAASLAGLAVGASGVALAMFVALVSLAASPAATQFRLQREEGRRIRIPRFTARFVAPGAILVSSIATALAWVGWIDFVGIPTTAVPLALLALLPVVVGIMTVPVIRGLLASGRFELVIDLESGMMFPTLGFSAQRGEPIPLDSIVSVEVVCAEQHEPPALARLANILDSLQSRPAHTPVHPRREGPMLVYRVMVNWTDGASSLSTAVASFSTDDARAEAFRNAVVEGIGGVAPPVPPTAALSGRCFRA
jgi:hypothetical protein